jgi:hypothetical protein
MPRAPVRRARDAELGLVPEMNSGFVADLDHGVDITEHLCDAGDRLVLSFPAEVRAVEVVDVVVDDPSRRMAVTEDVPCCLKQRSGRQPAIREPHHRHAIEDRGHHGIAPYEPLEGLELNGHRRVLEVHAVIVTAAAA